MKNSLLIISLSFLFFNSCKKDTPEKAVSSGGGEESIIPLAQGNVWNYRNIFIPSDDTSYFSLSISGDITIGSEHWYKEFYNDTDYIFVINKADGHHFYSDGDDDLIFKYPASTGDQYISNGSSDTTLVLNTGTMISVPAGQFSCYEYKKWSGNSGYTLLYVSSDVGWVKIVDYINGNIISVEELMSYDLH